jgi:hypothetical protein
MLRYVCIVSGLLVVVGSFGCTANNDPAPPMVPVKGTVKLDNKPMSEGAISFEVSGQPPKSIDIKAGEYSGEAFVGKNKVHVTLMKKGPAATTDPNTFTSINGVAAQFSGPGTTLGAEVSKGGGNDFKFEVKSR